MNDPLLTIIITVWNQERLIIRALDSVPQDKRIEILVVDDGSTDNTVEAVKGYMKTSRQNIRLIEIGADMGVGYARNVGMDNARGKYMHHLDSDDWLHTYEYQQVMNYLDGTDIVYFDLQINDGRILALSPETKRLYCGFNSKFYRMEFVGGIRCPIRRHHEDWFFHEEVQAKPHTERYTHICAYHYTYPRDGSLSTEDQST